MKKLLPLIAACVISSIPISGQAMTDKYAPGDTKLAVTEDGFAFEIRTLVDPGSSLRLYARPRNSNCTGANYDDNKKSLAWHDNPLCDSGKWGWVALDVPSLNAILADSDKTIEVGARIGGTLKSYDVGFAATVDPSGTKVIIGGLHSEHKK